MCLCYPRKSGLIRKFNHLRPVYHISYSQILVYLISTRIGNCTIFTWCAWNWEQVDVRKLRSSTLWLEWLGQNAMLVFALVAASDIFPSALQGFYWRRPENNLVPFLPLLLMFSSKWVFFLLVSLVKDKDLSGPADVAHRPWDSIRLQS